MVAQSEKVRTFDVSIFDRTYRVTALTRGKAVTRAIERYTKDFPESTIPVTVLRSLVSTSEVRIRTSGVAKEDVEKLFKKEREVS